MTSNDIISTINRIYDDPESVIRHLFELLRSPNEDDNLQGEVNFTSKQNSKLEIMEKNIPIL